MNELGHLEDLCTILRGVRDELGRIADALEQVDPANQPTVEPPAPETVRPYVDPEGDFGSVPGFLIPKIDPSLD